MQTSYFLREEGEQAWCSTQGSEEHGSETTETQEGVGAKHTEGPLGAQRCSRGCRALTAGSAQFGLLPPRRAARAAGGDSQFCQACVMGRLGSN